MAAYRLYFLDASGRIQARQDFTAEDDCEAKTIGNLLRQACADCYQGYELWQAARRLARQNDGDISASSLTIAHVARPLQERMLELQEALLGSHWRAAQSAALRDATEALRRSLNGNGATCVSHQDVLRYVCANTGADMMSLQLAEGMRLMLRGSLGFGRLFDEYFAVVEGEDCACGAAFKSASQMVVSAIETSPIFAGQESLAVLRTQGVAACVSTPFLGRNGRVAGMLSVHRDRIWHPFDNELAQLRHIANDIAAAIADPLSAAARRISAAV